MVGSLTPNLVGHVDQAGKTTETRSPTAGQRADVGLEPFLCRFAVTCLEFVRPLEPRCLLGACLLNVQTSLR